MVSIIIPTFNEAENLPRLIPLIFDSLAEAGVDGEVIVVDDFSPDGTAKVAQKLAVKFPVKVLVRNSRHGLAGAVIDGIAIAKGDVLGIMDGDGSHDPKVLPKMIAAIKEGFELVIGSRYISGGEIGSWSFLRYLVSGAAKLLAFLLTPVKDPVSGYLLFRRQVIEGVTLSSLGFKIGLEIIVKGHYNRFFEVPYTFKDRISGESKLNGIVVFQYLLHLVRLYHYRFSSNCIKPVQFTSSFWRKVFLIMLFASAVATWKLGQAVLSDSEAFYAEAAGEMFVKGDWLVPWFNFARFFDKPPLYYWLEIIGYYFLGITEFAARLPAALAFVGISGLTAVTGAVLFDSATGLIGGLLFVCTMGFYLYSHTVLVEPLLAFWIVAALVSFLLWHREPSKRIYLYLVYAASALAVLTKGLTGIIFPFLIIGIFLLTACSRSIVKSFFDLKGVAVFSFIVLPWHIYTAMTNKGFLWFYFVHEQFLRFFNLRQITDPHITTALFLGVLILLLFPWSIFLPASFFSFFKEWRKGETPSISFWFLILWAGVVIGFFCISKYKLEYYSLPAWLPLLLVVARYWRRQILNFNFGRKGILFSLLFLCIVSSIAIAAIPIAIVSYGRELPHPWIAEGAKYTFWILLGASLTAILACWKRFPVWSLFCLSFAMLPIFNLAQHGVVVVEHYLSNSHLAKVAANCLDLVGTGNLIHEETEEDIYVGGVTFYTKRKVWLLKSHEDQRFPFPWNSSELYYMTPDTFAALWKGPELVLFIGDIYANKKRPWSNDKEGNSVYYLVTRLGKQGVIANKPVCQSISVKF